MTTKVLNPVPGTFTVIPSLRTLSNTRIIGETPTYLNPYKLRYWDSPAYRMRNGWPTAPPRFDIVGSALISTEGNTISFRQGPTDVTTGADIRWIASEGFDDMTLEWHPFYSALGDEPWMSSSDWMPTLIEDYTYEINNEAFTQAVINFDADLTKHMWMNLDYLEGSSGFTIIIAGTLNSVYGNTEGREFSGIVANGYPTPDTAETFVEDFTEPFEVRLANKRMSANVGRTTSNIACGDLVGRVPPFYMALVLGRPESSLYVSKGPKDLREAKINSGTEGEPFSGNIVLGRSMNDSLHTADLAVLEINVYADRLTTNDVRRELSLLSSVYGAES